MIWLVSALVLVWLVPLVVVANGALVHLFSGTFRAWIYLVLFGDGDPDPCPLARSTQCRPADREARTDGRFPSATRAASLLRRRRIRMGRYGSHSAGLKRPQWVKSERSLS